MVRSFVRGTACVLMIGIFSEVSLGCETKTTYDNKVNEERVAIADSEETKEYKNVLTDVVLTYKDGTIIK